MSGDDSSSLFELFDDKDIQKLHKDDKSISFFFASIGDARDLYKTIIDIADKENSGKAPRKEHHFTVNDINKGALTRDLVIWMLLEDLWYLKI